MAYVCFAAAGLLAGGVIAMQQQRRPFWLRIALAALAALFLYLGLRAT